MTKLRGMLSGIEVEFQQLLAEKQVADQEKDALRGQGQVRYPSSESASVDNGAASGEALLQAHVVEPTEPHEPVAYDSSEERRRVSKIGPFLRGPSSRPPQPPESMEQQHVGSYRDNCCIEASMSDEDISDVLSPRSVQSYRTKASSYTSLTNRMAMTKSEHEETLHQLASAWAESGKALRKSPSRRSLSHIYTANILRSGVIRAGESLTEDSKLQRFVTRPSSPKRIFWDLMSVAIMTYDMITIPLELFRMGESLPQYIIGLVTAVFWTLDIATSFLGGYHIGGLIEMRPRRVALHYLRTWFPIDILVVSVDWSVILVDSGSDQMDGVSLFRLNKTLRIVRVLRVLRLLRLLRMLKVLAVISELHNMIHSEELLTCLNVFAFILGILMLNHYIACCWYGVGAALVTDDPRDSWVSRLAHSIGRSPDTAYYYTTALHWSLTQFTPASMEVVPCNTYERIFTIGVMLFAVILFSSLLSSITTSMINLRKLSAEKRKQVSLVRRYITDKQVTLDLGNRIFAFLRHHNYNVSQRQVLHEDHIVAFRILPESLRSQLRCEVFLPMVNPHALFRIVHKTDQNALVAICTTAMSEQTLSMGQEKFACNSRATHMYIACSGSLVYYLGDDASNPEEISRGVFMCEACLWIVWDHKGKLVAATPSEMIAINAAAFQTLMAQGNCSALCRTYASIYLAHITELDSVDPDGMTDIVEDMAAIKELVKEAYYRWTGSGEIRHIHSFETDPEVILNDDAASSVGVIAPTTFLGFIGRLLRGTRSRPGEGLARAVV